MSEENEAQGRLEEVLREAQPRPSAREEARPAELEPEFDETEGRAEDDAPAGGDPAVEETEPDPESDDVLGDALDTLEASVSLLLDRYEELAERCATAEETSAEARRKMARLAGEGLDPDALERKIRELEEDNDRLMRHSEHLEERIRGLLARVRYVVEA